jgi:hypothetical protein
MATLLRKANAIGLSSRNRLSPWHRPSSIIDTFRSRQQSRLTNFQSPSFWIIGRENPCGCLYKSAKRLLSDHGNHGLFYGSSANGVVPRTVIASIGTRHRADDEGVHL